MRLSKFAGLALLATCGTAFAQQPLTLPGRSQSSGQQAVDNAACYAYANQTTKVNMARESQTPPKNTSAEPRVMVSPSPVAPPLPPTATSGASAAVAASGASAAVAAGASGAQGVHAASATMAAGASAPHGASAAMPSSGAVAASGASDAILSGDMKMPPLPPPEPPMVRYWRAYSDCMQNRGYFVR
ncbi:hypothetical protein [Candidatus Burkholderia verschuerenii]|uniref:hypothetical protein n=1 Tax=Candidatus Burkholderia verschuerenii TaxID=242163 RepID=UPI00067E63C0|nr:hypothetical protein [Candidatus Burkholderia verschuerenii]